MAVILEAFLILLILGVIVLAGLFVILGIVVPPAESRDRAIPKGRQSDRVTSEDCHEAHRAIMRDREAVKAFDRAQMAAGGASC